MSRVQCHWCGDYFYGKNDAVAGQKRRNHIQHAHRGTERAAAVNCLPLEVWGL